MDQPTLTSQALEFMRCNWGSVASVVGLVLSGLAAFFGKRPFSLYPPTGSGFGVPQESPSVTLEDEKQNIIVQMNRNIEGITDDALQQLLVLARRTALHADEKIDEILQELQKPELTIISARYGAGNAWPRFLAQTGKARARDPLQPLPLALSIRCAIMQEYLKGGEPTELMLAIIAQMPLDGSRIKDEMEKPLSL